MSKHILTIYGVPHPELDYEGSSNGAITSYKEAYEHYLDGGDKTLELVDGKLTYKSYVSFRDFPKMVKAIKYIYIYELIKEYFGEKHFYGKFFRTEDNCFGEKFNEEWFKMYFVGWEKMEDTEKLNVFAEFMLDKFTPSQTNDILEAEHFLQFLAPEMNMIMSQLCDAEQEGWVWQETKGFWEAEVEYGDYEDKLNELLEYTKKYDEKIKREKEKKIALVIHTINTACWSPHTPLGIAMFNFRLKADGLDEIIV